MSNTYLVKTLKGLEPVLAKEITDLGGRNVQSLRRAVSFEGSKAMMYRANYCLRTALRILVPIREFAAQTPQHLYNHARRIPWDRYLDVDGTLAIDSVVNSHFFTHSKYAALKFKDAIVDQYREKYGRRPSVNKDYPDLRIHLHINHDRCSVSIDSSGESLHKRAYRLSRTQAPLNEVLAAGMIILSGWDKKSPFIDPMCGSGTIVIEAASIASNQPPQRFREEFGFMKWKDYDEDLWESIKAEAWQKVVPITTPILGSDMSGISLKIAQENLLRAGFQKEVRLRLKNFSKLPPPPPGPGVLMMNPPYGERLAPKDILSLYKMIGDQLKQQYPGYAGWIISSNMQALKHIGLRADKRITLFNGPLECSFRQYKIFAGKEA